jgi:hypothetical protein
MRLDHGVTSKHAERSAMFGPSSSPLDFGTFAMKMHRLVTWQRLRFSTIAATCLLPLLPFAMEGLSG